MAGAKDRKGSGRPIIIVKNEIVEGGHHGGAWKVAYADFVTAMMAFFLLMWLLNATTEDQRKGLADYFSPNNLLSHASSGTGDPFGGHTAFDEGALVSDRGTVEVTEGKRPKLEHDDENTSKLAGVPGTNDQKVDDPDAAMTDPSSNRNRAPTDAEIQAEKINQEKAAFEKTAEEIRTAVHADPTLAQLAKQLAIDMTPEGLRIQIMDEVKSPMFASGSAAPNDQARELLKKIVPFLQKLPEGISIAGYTDAAPYTGQGKSNWELSSDRANASRRLLTDGGLPENRIRTVTAHADRDPLLPGDPTAPANRRIAIVVLREAQTPPSAAPSVVPPPAAPPPAAAPAR